MEGQCPLPDTAFPEYCRVLFGLVASQRCPGQKPAWRDRKSGVFFPCLGLSGFFFVVVPR